MRTLTEIFRPYLEGQPAIFLSNRSLFDLVVDDDGKVRPLIEAVRREARVRHGMACVSYSLATGTEWLSSCVEEDKDRNTIEKVLQEHHLLNIPQDQNEVVRVIRGVASLSRMNTQGLKWSNGDDLRFAFIFMFSQHLTPGNLQNGTQTDTQLVASELAHITAQSLALRASGNYIIFHGEDGLIDTLVCSALHHVRLRQPDIEEKKTFLSSSMALYTAACFEPNVSVDSVANLTANTPNRGLEALLRASHRGGRPVTTRELLAQKAKDVEQLSEGTLELLDTDKVAKSALYGRNIATACRIMERLSAGLVEANSHMPANVLLAGPPGTGKTELTKKTARDGKAAAYLMHSPKGPYVGMTERLARQQQMLLGQWTPNVALCDEITEQFPLERSDFDGDSGASRAVMGQLLTSLSDETRRGKALLVATTNCPWRIGAAMRSRFSVIPVLHPLEEDFPGILASIAEQVKIGTCLDPQDPQVREAAKLFYEKGANPRHIRGALSIAVVLRGDLLPGSILFAAHDLCSSTDLVSAVYADYWAIRCCSSRSFFPWADDPSSYPCPKHLADVVNPVTGEVRDTELNRRIEELRPHANL
jgi:hypothetical protein